MDYVLRCQMKTLKTLPEAFRVFENPHNLERITPPWLHFQILTKNLVMRSGAVIDYRIRWLIFPMKWRTLITEYSPPSQFVDEQARGPYDLWRHRHTFQETPEGTIVGDEVRYRLPLGILGRIAHALIVQRQLVQIFEFRQKALAGMLGRVVEVSPPRIEPAA